MNTLPITQQTDLLVTSGTIFALILLSGIIFQEFSLQHTLLLLCGVGFGFALLHAAFGFSGAWRQIIRDQRGEGVRAQILL